MGLTSDQTLQDLNKMFIGAEVNYAVKASEDAYGRHVLTSDQSNAAAKELLKQGNGARGQIHVAWDAGGGHAMAYEVRNGVVYLIDAQTVDIYPWSNSSEAFENRIGQATYMAVYRTDNLELNTQYLQQHTFVENTSTATMSWVNPSVKKLMDVDRIDRARDPRNPNPYRESAPKTIDKSLNTTISIPKKIIDTIGKWINKLLP